MIKYLRELYLDYMNKKKVCIYNKMLLDNNLVSYTSWNVSFRYNEKIYIKPSWVLFEKLKPSLISVVNINTLDLLSWLKPSTDLLSHIYIYKNNSNINSIVHTHSNYATSFAVCGKNIPLCLTSIADEFWEEIKCSWFAEIWWEDIWKEVIRLAWKSWVILLQNHWVFAIWKDLDSAIKKAIMVEDIAKTVFLAKNLWEIIILNDDIVNNCYFRYKNNYWQK